MSNIIESTQKDERIKAYTQFLRRKEGWLKAQFFSDFDCVDFKVSKH